MPLDLRFEQWKDNRIIERRRFASEGWVTSQWQAISDAIRLGTPFAKARHMVAFLEGQYSIDLEAEGFTVVAPDHIQWSGVQMQCKKGVYGTHYKFSFIPLE